MIGEAGREVTVYADHVVDDQGTQFGLWNLPALCGGEPERTCDTVAFLPPVAGG